MQWVLIFGITTKTALLNVLHYYQEDFPPTANHKQCPGLILSDSPSQYRSKIKAVGNTIFTQDKGKQSKLQ